MEEPSESARETLWATTSFRPTIILPYPNLLRPACHSQQSPLGPWPGVLSTFAQNLVAKSIAGRPTFKCARANFLVMTEIQAGVVFGDFVVFLSVHGRIERWGRVGCAANQAASYPPNPLFSNEKQGLRYGQLIDCAPAWTGRADVDGRYAGG